MDYKDIEIITVIVGLSGLSVFLVVMGYLLMGKSVFMGVTSTITGVWVGGIILNTVYESRKRKEDEEDVKL
jgi:hypothetical protein